MTCVGAQGKSKGSQTRSGEELKKMCGFIAVFSTGAPVTQEFLLPGTRAMHHRGPDGHGFWMSGNGRLGMGHARLSIIDLETGNQPIANEDESVHIVVNGEFYDHDRIRAIPQHQVVSSVTPWISRSSRRSPAGHHPAVMARLARGQGRPSSPGRRMVTGRSSSVSAIPLSSSAPSSAWRTSFN